MGINGIIDFEKKDECEIFDMFISVGIACRPAHHMKMCKLRAESYPLDWQMSYSLDTVIHLFETSFEDFFCDIKELAKPGQGNNRRVEDVTNHIVSIHHFSKEKSLAEAQKSFISKMKCRFERMDAELKNASKIVFCGNRSESQDDIVDFLQSFSMLYPNLKIKFLNVRDDKTLESNQCYRSKRIISDKLEIEEWIFNDSVDTNTNENYDWRGNIEKWSIMLSHYLSNQVKKKFAGSRGSIVIYGAGKMCLELLATLKRYEFDVEGVAVTNMENNPTMIEGIEVDIIDNFEKESEVIISVQNIEEQMRIRTMLQQKGFKNVSIYCKGCILPI